MKIDLTYPISLKAKSNAEEAEKKASYGHLGTHFDVMDKEFPLDYFDRAGIAFDVSDVTDRQIDVADVDLGLVGAGMFVAFYSGVIDRVEYGTKEYFTNHPELSDALIDALIDKKVSIIGLDWAGAKRGSAHPRVDKYCADHGVFIVENLCNLEKILDKDNVTIHTYPLNFTGLTGLPSRVAASVEEK